ncbi:DUF7344 domain-containing protein [Halorussus caseinilyticus]|uniref:DUF7344 domain-containing protein n=2 Tax=Halorussus caseinilyticus TaxID=3034025 RepID=A0ABD5WEB4_9EURY|nr:hypothetical protein [Halorussus sp. DT72]
MSDETSDGGGDDRTPPFDSEVLDGSGRTDELFEAVADPRARRVLSYLESVSVNVVELDTLVDHVVECEAASEDDDSDTHRSDDADRHRQRVAVALHHNHLPKLDDAAVIDYDPRTKAVRYWGDDRVTAYLEMFEAVERS